MDRPYIQTFTRVCACILMYRSKVIESLYGVKNFGIIVYEELSLTRYKNLSIAKFKKMHLGLRIS